MFWILFSLLLKESLVKIDASKGFHKKFKELRNECYSNRNNYIGGNTSEVKCEISFHGSCWPEALANVTVVQTCAELFFYPSANASRRCNGSGIWEKPNISSCASRIPTRACYTEMPHDYLQRVYVGLSWCSLAVMVPSLILTFYLLKGKNERFNVHTNLILAFILRTVTFFIHHYGELDATGKSRVLCNVFWILNRYFAAAEITWMLNEALLLLRKVVIIFDKKSYLKYYMIVGWGSPFVLIMGIYLPTMISVMDQRSKRCWSNHKDSVYMLVLYVPLTLILILNFMALIYTVSVFVRRQRGGKTKQDDLLKIKKAIKGTLMLSPLLGVIYLLIMFQPDHLPTWYQYILRIIYPMQGTLACLVYLTFNGELHHKLKLKYRSSFKERRSILDNGHAWSFNRSRNTEKSSVAKPSQSSPCPSVDHSNHSQSSPTCSDNGPKCGCPDAAPPTVNTGDEEKETFLTTTSI